MGLAIVGLLPAGGLFLSMDVTFVSANAHKIPAGGWFPLLIGAVSLTLMLCWRRGRAVALARRDQDAIPLNVFIASLSHPGAPVRMRGTAFYLTTQAETVPAALALNVKHNGVVHGQVKLLKVITDRAPRLAEENRMQVQELSAGFQRVELHFGFAEKPDIPPRWPCTRKRLAVIRPVARSSWVGKRLFHR
jgi:KUP system potassium uptake protein